MAKKDRKPVMIELEYAVNYDGQNIEKLILHRPKGKHLKKIKQDSGIEEMLLLACHVVEIPGSKDGPGVTNALMQELDGADCIQISERLSDFLESGQKIGKL